MACECVKCPECNGSGHVWYSISGKYLGSHRLDDLDQMEPCEQCNQGVTEACWECAEAMADFYDDAD